MLLFHRKTNQQIVIEDDITISVCRVDGENVLIGIEAPGDCIVRRGELLTQWAEDHPDQSGWSTYRFGPSTSA